MFLFHGSCWGGVTGSRDVTRRLPRCGWINGGKFQDGDALTDGLTSMIAERKGQVLSLSAEARKHLTA